MLKMLWYIFLGYGALGGFIRAILGVQKKMREGTLEFDYFVFFKTIFLGGAVGLVCMALGLVTPIEIIGMGLAGDLAIEKIFVPMVNLTNPKVIS